MAEQSPVSDEELRGILADLSGVIRDLRDSVAVTDRVAASGNTSNISFNLGGLAAGVLIVAAAIMSTVSLLGYIDGKADRNETRNQIRELRDQLETQDAYRQQYGTRLSKLESK